MIFCCKVSPFFSQSHLQKLFFCVTNSNSTKDRGPFCRQGSFISYESALSKTFSPLDDGTAPPARKDFQDAFYDEESWEF